MKPFCWPRDKRKAPRSFGRIVFREFVSPRFYSGRISRPIFANKCCDRSIMSALSKKALFFFIDGEKVARKEREREKKRKRRLYNCIQVYRNLFGVVGRVREFLWDETSNKYGKYLCVPLRQ